MSNQTYVLIESPRVLDERARVYFISVRSAAQASRDKETLERFAARHSHFFQKRSAEVSAFVRRLLDSIPAIPHPISCSAREFVRSLANGQRPTLAQYQLENIKRMRYFLNLDYRLKRFA